MRRQFLDCDLGFASYREEKIVMRTSWVWSVSLGRWWGVHVRLHLFFILFAILVGYVAQVSALLWYNATTTDALPGTNWMGIACPLVVLVSVLLHELAHVVVARHLGGTADEIVLGPLGGLAPARVPYEPHSELVSLMAGTLVNAAVCCIAAAWIFGFELQTDVSKLMTFHIQFFDGSHHQTPALAFLKLVFWVNWSLILVNLLPVFPFDGARSLQNMLTFLFPEWDSGPSIVRLGKVFSLVLLGVAWYLTQQVSGEGPGSEGLAIGQPPVWLALTLLSVYIFFGSRMEEQHLSQAEHQDDSVFGYDFSQGYTSLERSMSDEEPERAAAKSPVGLFRMWLEQRRALREKQLQEQEVEDERRVDEVLERLHQGGMQSLTSEERALLERVSQRYRSRQA